MQVLIVDALNLIRRIYAAQERPYLPLPDQISDATKNQIVFNTCNAITQALDKLIATIEPTHGIVVFDGEGDSWRHKMYAEYKAGRQPMPTILREGMGKVREAIEQKGFKIHEQQGQEADDLVGALASKVAQSGHQATIISTDKGFLQLLGDNIQVYDHFGRKYLDEDHVKDKFGVAPHQLVNYWGLVGDSSNNIPGLPGIGPKSAQDILLNHTSLKEALGSDSLNKKLREKLQANLESFKLYRKLCALKLDVQLGLNLNQIRLGSAAQTVNQS